MKSIAVVIDGSENDTSSLKTAVACARVAGARLTVYHNRMPALLATGTYDMAITTIDNTAHVEEALKRAQAAYAATAGAYSGSRFVEVEAGQADVLELAAPYHDVLLLERLSSTEGPDAVAFNSALWDIRSPVLVMPPEPMTGEFHQVVLSWNGTAQAGRALRAALPLIQAAGHLVVLSRAGTEKDLELERYLDANGVKVDTWKNYGDPSLSARGWARSLLGEVKTLEADLLVMGAFGGAVGSFFGFGRATEKIATSAQIPVLFSA